MTNYQGQTEQAVAVGGDSYVFGRFRLQIEANGQTLFAEANPIPLSTAESTILRVLIERRGEFVKTEDLLKSISSSPMASENLLHGAWRGLRRTLNDTELIKNERSRGYSFTGHVEKGSDQIVEPASTDNASLKLADGSITSVARQRERVRPRDPFVVVALLVTAPVVLLPFGLGLFGGSWERLPGELGFIRA